ncbi:uncharacterized protein LOC123406362 [Hordeum vulgare subsp. vulgare]|uniref:Jacalin-type lectin domain-containing protein n=1 Tax=Hordeum vulgare subsp. vulgare TaxID=112509 RepID=A0A8I6YY01_HORVV|nr:uncharacterized protein LOC123406362 [Hordeum vulgare subsp. vulgare]
MATSLKKHGPHGCNEGSAFDVEPSKPPKTLTNINIWSNDGPDGKINAISFNYIDNNGDEVQKGTYGKEAGTKHSIPIGQGEYLTNISGYICPCISALNFKTSKNKPYGQFGKFPNTGDTSFVIDVDQDSIVALFGRYDDQIRAIGASSGPRLDQ